MVTVVGIENSKFTFDCCGNCPFVRYDPWWKKESNIPKPDYYIAACCLSEELLGDTRETAWQGVRSSYCPIVSIESKM